MLLQRLILPVYCVIAGIFLLFVIAIGAILIRSEYLQFKASGFTPVEATVVSSDLVRSGRRGRSYSIEIEYEYIYDAMPYKSAQVSYGVNSAYFSFSNSGEAMKMLYDHPAGSTITAFVDPDRPSRAVLDNSPPTIRKMGLTVLTVLAVNLFLGIILWLIYSVLAENRRKAFARSRIA